MPVVVDIETVLVATVHVVVVTIIVVAVLRVVLVVSLEMGGSSSHSRSSNRRLSRLNPMAAP